MPDSAGIGIPSRPNRQIPPVGVVAQLPWMVRMSFDVDRMSPCNGARSLAGRVALIAVLMAMSLSSTSFGEDNSPRNPSRSSPGTQLPPRGGTNETGSAAKKTSPASTGSGLWTTIISLTTIVSGLSFVAYWLRPYLGVTRGLPVEALELLGRRAIEPKVTIHLVRCGGKVLIVSVSPDGARTLSEITDPIEIQRLVAACHSPRETRFPMPAAEPILPPTPAGRGAAPRVVSFSSEESRRAS